MQTQTGKVVQLNAGFPKVDKIELAKLESHIRAAAERLITFETDYHKQQLKEVGPIGVSRLENMIDPNNPTVVRLKSSGEAEPGSNVFQWDSKKLRERSVQFLGRTKV